MILISHRGNLEGRNENLENHPKYIEVAYSAGFYVEIDLWVVENKLFLGHDEPQFLIDSKFIDNKFYYVHCKNEDALSYLNNSNLNCDYFWHENDYYTMTSKNKIWSHFKSKILPNSICVIKDDLDSLNDYSNCFGICSDFVAKYIK